MTTDKEKLIEEEYGLDEPSSFPVMAVKTKKKKDDNVVFTSFLETPDYILEQIVPAGGAEEIKIVGVEGQYIKWDKQAQNDKYEVVNYFPYNGKEYYPITNKLVDREKVLFPSQLEEYGTDVELVEEIKDFMYKYFEPPESHRGILPFIVLFYWVSDRFPFVPYTHFMGLPKTGKSTALEVMGSICYKGTKASGSITIASLFRLASMFRGTLLINEFDMGNPGSDGYRNFLTLLKSGVEDDPIYRTEGEGKKDVEVYDIKSPRIFASQEPILDAALQSRTIMVKMSSTSKRVPLYRLKAYEAEAKVLRNKLLLWRLRHYSVIDLEDIEFGIEALQGFDRRVQQVLTPIYYLADTEAKKIILEFAKEQEKETYIQRQEELDGQMFLFINEQFELGNAVSIGMVTEFLNDTRKKQGYKSNLTERKVSNMVRKVFSFNTEIRGHDKLSYIVENPEKLKELCLYYGVSLPLQNVLAPQAPQEVIEEVAKLDAEIMEIEE